MKVIDTADVYGHTIFCDDIRIEMDGKASFIGSYMGQLSVREFPAVLPKFGFGINLYQRREVFIPDTKLLIFMPGDSEDTASIQANVADIQGGEALRQADSIAGLLPDQKAYVAVRANLIIAPFTVSQAGVIKVRAVHDDKLIRLGAINIMQPLQPITPKTS